MTEELMPVRHRLKMLREQTGLSVGELAEASGMKKSSYQYYEDNYKKEFLPIDLINRIKPALTQRGIAEDRLLALAGVSRASDASPKMRGDLSAGKRQRSLISFVREEETDPEEQMAHIEEVDVRAAQGAGANNHEHHEEVVAEWTMPRDVVRVATQAAPRSLKIITVVGDSMPKSFRPFEKVLVDTSDKIPTPPGIFIVWDGLGNVAKKVSHIPFSDPPTVRISSENPEYPPYERTLDEAYIQGRVLGRWQWV